MPKKYKTENTKSVVARSRKADKLAEEKEQLNKAKEDAFWRDDDKHANRKIQRKEDKEQKRKDDLIRKQENRTLEEDEKSELCASINIVPKKVTAYQLQKQRDSKKIDQAPQILTHLDMPLVENLNRNVDETVSGSGVDGALRALSCEDDAPKLSMAAAFEAFKDERLPELKKKNTQLKFSQLNDIIRKEWQRSPRNPINQK